MLQLALSHSHVVALGKHRVGPACDVDAASVRDRHRRVVTKFTLVHELIDLGGGGPDNVHLCNAPAELERLR